ncbi:MAG: DNA-binding protein HU-beta [Francisellaceae bacterium]|jgi:DNA-binding protein HU-beta
MTKSEFITLMQDCGKFDTKVDTEKALEGFLGAVKATLEKGDKISFVGFGSFDISQRAARAGRNPQTGETIQIKASNVVRFKAGKELKEAVN